VTPKEEQPVHYAVVRADLSFGVQAAMLMHAVGISVKEPHVDGMWALALHVRDEAHLMEVAGWLLKAGFGFVIYRDPDPPFNGAAMALGVAPTFERERLKKCLQRLPLVASPPRASVQPQPAAPPVVAGSAVGRTTGGGQ